MKAIALPDGDGIIANKTFWKEYFDLIGFDLKDTTDDLDILSSESCKHFPTTVCTNSKVRLGKASLLQKEVSHFLFFLRKDNYVNNCPASVYRIRWIKEKFPHIKTIIWPYDLNKSAGIKDNLLNLANVLTEVTPYIEQEIKDMIIPERKAIYSFPSNNNKEKALLIGVSPHSIDPYRKTDLMDFLMTSFNVYSPICFLSQNLVLKKREIDDTIYFKEDAIFHAIDEALSQGIKNFILVSDPLDLPGNFTFPLIEAYLSQKGVNSFKDIKKNRAGRYIELKISHKNHQQIKLLLNKFQEIIENDKKRI